MTRTATAPARRRPPPWFSIANALFRKEAFFEAALLYDLCIQGQAGFSHYSANKQETIERLSSAKSNRKPIFHAKATTMENRRLRTIDALLKHRELVSDDAWEEGLKLLKDHPEIDLLLANYSTIENLPEWLSHLNEYLGRSGLRPAYLTTDSPKQSVFEQLQYAAGPARHGDLVSVCMTTFNAVATVGYAAASILAQDYKDLELIVVDDASTDGTRDILSSLAAADPRVRLVLSQRNEGTYAGRNAALGRAKGRYFTVNDSDDLAHPQRLAQQLDELSRASTPALGQVAQWLRMTHNGRFIYKNAFRGGYRHFAVATLIFEREPVLGKIGFYDRVRMGADMEYLTRLNLAFGPAAILEGDSPLLLSASHSTSLTGHAALGIDDVYGLSETRRAYAAAWKAWHRQAEGFFLSSNPPQRPFPAPGEMVID
jgi:hypothetical protein